MPFEQLSFCVEEKAAGVSSLRCMELLALPLAPHFTIVSLGMSAFQSPGVGLAHPEI